MLSHIDFNFELNAVTVFLSLKRLYSTLSPSQRIRHTRVQTLGDGAMWLGAISIFRKQ